MRWLHFKYGVATVAPSIISVYTIRGCYDDDALAFVALETSHSTVEESIIILLIIIYETPLMIQSFIHRFVYSLGQFIYSLGQFMSAKYN